MSAMSESLGDGNLQNNLSHYQALFKKYGCVPPNRQQFIFTKHYLKTLNITKAYKAAGYEDLTHVTNQRWLYSRMARIKNLDTVRLLMKLAAHEWVIEQKLTAEWVANEALKAYNNADNVSDQLKALKLVSEFVKMAQ